MVEFEDNRGVLIGAGLAGLTIVFFLMFFTLKGTAPSIQVIQSGIPNTENTNNENPNSPCSYLIFISGTIIKAKNCSTGKLDFSGTDASTVIQSSLTAMPNGGLLFIKQGRYTINHPINFTASSQTIKGEGFAVNSGTWLDLCKNCNINMFQYTGVPQILFPTIEDLYMQGNGGNNARGNGTFFNGGSTTQVVKDAAFIRVYIDGFKQFQLVFNNAHDYRIANSAIEHGFNNLVFIKAGDSIRVTDTLFRLNFANQSAIQIGCTTIGGINHDSNCGASGSSPSKFANGVVISSNKFERGGIVVENADPVIHGNTFDQMLAGQNGTYFKYNDTGSIVTNNLMNGSTLASYGVAIDNSTSQQILISANQMLKFTNAKPVFNAGTNTIVRNNVPTSINNDLIAGAGISINQGIQSNTISASGNTNQPCDYIIYSNSSNIILAKNCLTGIVDFTGTDFSTVTQNVINNFPQNIINNHIVYIQPRVDGIAYSITKRINVTVPIIFRGNGIDTVLALHQNENGEMFYFSKGILSTEHNVGIEQMRLFGNGTAQTGGDFIVKVDTGIFDALFYRVWFDTGYGGGLNTFSNTQPNVVQCWFENMLGNGLVSVGSTNINPPAWLENAGTSSKTIDSIFFNNAQKDVYVYNDLSSPRITGNIFVGSLRGSVVVNNDRYTDISQNWFKRVSVQTNNTFPAILLESTSAGNKANNTLIDGNNCFNDGSNFPNFFVDSDANVNHVDIIANDCPFVGSFYRQTAGSTDFLVSDNRDANLVVTLLRDNVKPIPSSTVTAGASVWTYTNNDGYMEQMILSTVGGQTAQTCNGINALNPTSIGDTCLLDVGQKLTSTWGGIAPVYTKVPMS